MTDQFVQNDRPSQNGRTSVWDLILDVFIAPGKAMARIADERPVGPAALLVTGLAVFTGILGLVITRDAMVLDLDLFLAEIPPELVDAVSAVMGSAAVFGAIFGIVGSVLWWFARAAIYGLIGELMGAERDGRAMLATLGFAGLPALLQAPVNLMLSRLGLPWLASFVGLVFWVWMLILTVLAIRAALRVETGRAIVVFLIPVGVGIAMAVLVGVGLFIAIISMASQIPMP